jgi:alkaline phosphatase D
MKPTLMKTIFLNEPISVRLLAFAIGLCLLEACSPKKEPVQDLTVIAFGSCGEQDKPQPVLALAAEQKPDAFIFLGDNIYGDTKEMDTLRKKYQMLAVKPEFQKLKNTTKLFATWDDHDYGWNDAGRHYEFKKESKEIFLDFFGDQGDSTIRQHEGIYHTVYLEKGGKRIQIILPDLRTFRDKLLPYNGNRRDDARFNYELDYSPYTTADSTMLGEEQWKWLEIQLMQPADLRIFASSTQFGITHNGYEAWANFPHEQARMIELIKKTKANGVVFISGDVHYAEVSKLVVPDVYPLYDITASGITSTWGFATPNDNRIDGAVMENHYGLISINWNAPDPEISLQIFDVQNNRRINRVIKLSEISF